MDPLAPEEVARRHASQPGLRLLTYREVGLPFWEVPIDCRVLARKPLPALEEFVLRCVAAELRRDEEIGAFLGLSPALVAAIMARLLHAGHIVPISAIPTQVAYALTARGQSALSDAAVIVAEQRRIELAYDGLLRRFALVEEDQRWRPRDLRDEGILEIPAFPADPPEVGPSDTPAVAKLLADLPRLHDHELLSVLGVAGRREKFFLRGVALVFESVDTPGDFAVKFALDGRLSDAHGHAFARAEGQRKMGIVGSLRNSGVAPESILSPDVLADRSDEPEVAALRRATESLRSRVAEAEERAASLVEGQSRDVLVQHAEDLQERLDAAEAALSRVPARLLEVHEHPGLLAEALATAKERLLIVSPWIRAAVVDDLFLSSLTSALERGVSVRIAYGIDQQKATQVEDGEAEGALGDLAARYANFCLVRLGDTHAKVLLVDSRFVVVTSFNWLSFRGDPRRPFRDERGTLVAIPDEIDRIYEDYMQRMACG